MVDTMIAVDAMGGDRAPDVVVEAIVQALKKLPSMIGFYLVGDEAAIQRCLPRKYDTKRIEIVHTPDMINMDEKVGLSIRHRTSTSMYMAIQMVKDGKAKAVTSCGNTAAYVALAKLILGTIPGYDRPALAAFLPGGKMFLDVGASVDCTPQILRSWAIGASVFAKKVLGILNPIVALLSIGSELGKGNKLVKETYPLLVEAVRNGCFSLLEMNVEPNKLLSKNADIVLADGFPGNIALKALEAAMDALRGFAKTFFRKRPYFIPLAILALPALPLLYVFYKCMKKQFGYEVYNGAPLIGVDGVCIKGHGRSNVKAYLSAIMATVKAVENDMVRAIKEGVKDLPV